jgi:tetrahydromethanopterin:alpha-L-glutamate ligase
MRFGIVVSDEGDWTAQSIYRAFLERDANPVFINFSMLSAWVGNSFSLKSNGLNLADLDGIVVRDMGRSGPQGVAFRFEALRALEDLGVPVTNSTDSIARAANKFATSMALQIGGVQTPKTMVTTSLKDAAEALGAFGKMVYKPLFGYKGRGIRLLSPGDDKALEELAGLLEQNGAIYLQEFVELQAPRDIRAFVVGDDIAGAIYRMAPPGAWISNLARGGKPMVCQVTDEIRDLAVKACRCVGATYSGVDLLETPEGLKVIEVNGTPSGRGIFEALGVDIGGMIADRIL